MPKFVSHLFLAYETGLQHPGSEAVILSATYFSKIQSHDNPFFQCCLPLYFFLKF